MLTKVSDTRFRDVIHVPKLLHYKLHYTGLVFAPASDRMIEIGFIY